jgi:hypothetical protein
MNIKIIPVVALPLLVFAFLTLAGCGGSSNSGPVGPLSDDRVNLIFVVSPDIGYQAAGDVSPDTGNLTGQGLHRSLLLATYLKEQVLGGRNVTSISVLEPTTHLQTANNYPDMAAIGYVQQFALLNQLTLQGTTANSYFLAATYGPGSEPAGVYTPTSHVAATQGLDFHDAAGNNVALATRIIDANRPGFYVFSAPWETISSLLTSINRVKGYGLSIPTSYGGPNLVYVISVTSLGAGFNTYNSNLKPSSSYPTLPSSVTYTGSCTQQAATPIAITRTGGVNGVIIPTNMNVNSTVYLIRHAEAHPGNPNWDDGNYVGTGQWRALSLPDALRGKISPSEVWSIDPSQAFEVNGIDLFSYVRPSLTILPYAIANDLPYKLVANFYLSSANDSVAAQKTSDFFFTGGTFSNKTIIVAWEHEHFPPLITYLLQAYGGSVTVPTLSWPDGDYDTIWRVQLDGSGNVTVDNTLCEGIDSATLPPGPPQF